ncbi:RNA-binding protein 40-like protein [Dinothrombium tinctorium]|uniref:RNA-binding region-containing protein 3 n=1 Tax=Dinothrombium tinctorium TaxID=1965070 RepID=A0A443RQM7_9ACAR|nr:RNA-binding protein 40-like protein [Dinothrombium tinctorium]
MRDERTKRMLFVRRFSSQLSLAERRQLLYHFGAASVHCFPDCGKLKYCAFATFETVAAASAALRQLHQLEVCGSILSVEYAKKTHFIPSHDESVPKFLYENRDNNDDFGKRLKQEWNQLHFISPALGLNYPFSPLLKYKYPPANEATVANISKALLHNPRFYTQVLHLMNKMNLPPPFEENKVSEVSFSEPDRDINAVAIRKKLSTGLIGSKEFKISKTERKKVPKIRSDQIFENVDTQKKNITIVVKDSLTSCDEKTSSIEVGNFGKIEPIKKDSLTPPKDNTDIDNFISDEELRKGRLSPSEFKNYPVFKNYESGKPSCRLYIKNLSKKVDTKDLKRIFGKFINWESEFEQRMFDILLLTKGRMKEQAFISFPSEEIAKKALQETNGFKLKDKYLVVVS